MNMENVLSYIDDADGRTTDRILDAVLERRRELFPEWDMVYFALPKNDPKEREALMKRVWELLMYE